MGDTWTINGREQPWYRSFSEMWCSPHIGRWMKRRLSKARRRAAKRELRGDRHFDRGLREIESECNWKLW